MGEDCSAPHVFAARELGRGGQRLERVDVDLGVNSDTSTSGGRGANPLVVEIVAGEGEDGRYVSGARREGGVDERVERAVESLPLYGASSDGVGRDAEGGKGGKKWLKQFIF